MPSVYGTDVYAYLVRARQQLDTESSERLFYAAFELRCAVESRLQQYLNAREDIAKHKKKGWRIAASEMELSKVFKDGRTIVELQLTVADVGEVRLFYTPVRKLLVSAAQRLGDLLHHRQADLDEADVWWKKTRDFLEDTFAELEFASAGTLLAPPMMSKDRRRVHMQSFFHRSNPQNDMLDRLVALPRGTYLNSRIHLHSSLPEHATSLLNSWRMDVT
jgi:hypothetical protein